MIPTYTDKPRTMRMTPVLAAEFIDIVRVMLDQIDGDPRAIQFFDSRLIQRCKEALQKSKAENHERYCGILKEGI